MKFYRAHVDSPNYSFESYAPTRQAAIDCLSDGLLKHARQRGASDAWLTDAVADINVYQLSFGPVYRDGVELP